jgi:imidazolonepropionase-like amidohydrolase
VSVLRVRGHALPTCEWVDLYADGDRWTTEPVQGAELVAEGWLVPGLVDAHTHPGSAAPGQPFDEDLLRDDLRLHVSRGVTMIRSPGLAGDPPPWFGRDPDVPRAVHAGRWIAQHGQFFDGWGLRAEHSELPRMAAAQAASTGWAPTLSVITTSLDEVRARPDSARRRWYLDGASAHAGLAAAAAEAGVVVLAGTDSRPHGQIADEVRALAAAGVPPHDALGAASWTARSYLGLAGLTPGEPADVVVYDEDPRTNLAQLDAPRAIVLRGVLIFPR